MSNRVLRRAAAACCAVVALVAVACTPPRPSPPKAVGGYDLPSDPTADTFQFASVFGGLEQPVNVTFAPDGRAFVAEKAGVIKTYENASDPTATVTADLRDDVRSVGEHGLVGLTVDNAYPTRPFIYAFYAWDVTGLWGDGCRANYQINGCLSGGRIVKITVDPEGVMVGAPQTLVDDRWCFQFTGHSVGSVEMLSDGSLIASAGEGASFSGTDYGQFGGQQLIPPVEDLTPRNPCGDPPGGVGVSSPATVSEGGSFRSQDILTDGDPVGWNGSIVRIDADTGEPIADNPLVGVGSIDDDAVVATGLRNPNRIAVQPGTDRVFVGNVGQNFAEEIERVDVTASPVTNSGWPCREGAEPNPPFAALDNVICEELLTAPDAKTQLVDPWMYYNHNGNGAAVTGLTFVPEGVYPAKYVGDLFFADYVRGNIWSVSLTPAGDVNRNVPPEAVAFQEGIVDLKTGPDGYLYSVNVFQGTVDRVVGADAPPVAMLEAAPQNGPSPLTVDLDASGSFQPGGGTLSFAWDLDDDGEFDDGTGPTAVATFAGGQNNDVHVQVTNAEFESSVATRTIYTDNFAPEVTVDVSSPLPWTAGEAIEFTIDATDVEDGPLSGTSVSWETTLRHCYEPIDCHSHPHESGTGTVASVIGPSHGFPSFLQLTVRATDSRGQTTEVSTDLNPATATLTLTSTVPGAVISIGESSIVTPATYTAILGDQVDVASSLTQVIDGVTYDFAGWSDGGAAAHPVPITGDLTLNLNLVPQ